MKNDSLMALMAVIGSICTVAFFLMLIALFISSFQCVA